MPPVSSGGTYLDNPQALVNEFLGRLREAEPINTLENSPLMGADARNVAEMGDIFKRLKDKYEQEGAKASLTEKPLREDLDRLFRERQDYLQSLDPGEIQPFRQRLADWTKASGLDIGNLNVQDFGGVQHETISHLLPWQKGYSFETGPKVIEGYTVPPSPASPLNEFLATEIDRTLLSGKPVDFRKSIFSRSGAQRLDNFYRSLGQYAAAMSSKGKASFSSKELEDPVTGQELGDRLTRYQEAAAASNPFAIRQGPEGTFASSIELPSHLGDVGLQLDEASKLFNWKFVNPLRQRFENLGRVQAPYEVSRDFLPSWAVGMSQNPSLLSGLGGRRFREARDLPTEETNYNRLANYGQNLRHYLSGIPGSSSKYGGAANLFFASDPLSMAAAATPEVLRNVKRAPASLLPGVADLIPSPEAVRTGYRQGPVAMGKQMAQEFVQSLPTAAAAAGVLSTPLAAPLAPGIGVGLVGTAGARALNEVVRQETGEGIVPKLRQAIGTAPRTGIASPTSTKPRPLTAQVRALTAAQRAEMARQQNRNELQRRIELAQQRFNPSKLEFGLSELLRGR